jgi:hypothetical protein
MLDGGLHKDPTMRAAIAIPSLFLATTVSAAAQAAEAPVMPADGAKVDCVVSVLLPGALLLQCGELFAGTMLTVPAGGYGGVLICEEKKELRCPDIIPATVKFDGIKFAENSLNGAAVTCTPKRLAGVVTFACDQ